MVFESITPGTIATEKSGTYGWSWDYIFIPDSETVTLANFEDDKRWDFWSRDAYFELAKYLNKKENT